MFSAFLPSFLKTAFKTFLKVCTWNSCLTFLQTRIGPYLENELTLEQIVAASTEGTELKDLVFSAAVG